jgi:dienelactone hydrolase
VRGSAILALVVVCVTILPAAVLEPSPPGWAPQWLRYWASDIRLGVAGPAKKALSLGRINVPDLRLYRDRLGEEVRLTRGDMILGGTLSRPTTPPPHPAILLLHASTAEGRKLGIYRVMARELTRRGYVVLTLDQRGFGDSDDPPMRDREDAFDYLGDARSAVDYLATVPGVDTARVVLMGHSFGGSVALAVGVDHPRVWKIVSIGPTRRFTERAATELEYRRRRAMHIMRLDEMIPEDVYLHYRNAINMETMGARLGVPGHKPVLLIDGAGESAADQRFMDAMVRDSIAEPRAHLRLRTGDHYANILNLGALVIYDRGVLAQLIEGIDSWLREN